MATQRARVADASCPAPWLDEKRGYLVDWLTQLWVRAARTRVENSEMWLIGPFGKADGIGAEFYQELAEAEGLIVHSSEPGAGLVESMRTLVGDAKLDPRIADFYERTSDYDIRVTSHWCGLFAPFGWLISFIFSRRLQQLDVPLTCRHRTEGLSSEVLILRDSATGERRRTGWLRRREGTNSVVYVGIYGHDILKSGDPVLKICFPLPNGNATVLFQQEVLSDGSLLLSARGKKLGDPGFYFLVRGTAEQTHVRFVRSVHERIHVYMRGDQLGADHSFRLFGLQCFRLNYELARHEPSCKD